MNDKPFILYLRQASISIVALVVTIIAIFGVFDKSSNLVICYSVGCIFGNMLYYSIKMFKIVK